MSFRYTGALQPACKHTAHDQIQETDRAMAFSDAVLPHDVQNPHPDGIPVATSAGESPQRKASQVSILRIGAPTRLHPPTFCFLLF